MFDLSGSLPLYLSRKKTFIFLSRTLCIGLVSIVLLCQLCAQSGDPEISRLKAKLADKQSELSALKQQINKFKWGSYKDGLRTYGLPFGRYHEHTAYYFEYAELDQDF